MRKERQIICIPFDLDANTFLFSLHLFSLKKNPGVFISDIATCFTLSDVTYQTVLLLQYQEDQIAVVLVAILIYEQKCQFHWLLDSEVILQVHAAIPHTFKCNRLIKQTCQIPRTYTWYVNVKAIFQVPVYLHSDNQQKQYIGGR